MLLYKLGKRQFHRCLFLSDHTNAWNFKKIRHQFFKLKPSLIREMNAFQPHKGVWGNKRIRRLSCKAAYLPLNQTEFSCFVFFFYFCFLNYELLEICHCNMQTLKYFLNDFLIIFLFGKLTLILSISADNRGYSAPRWLGKWETTAPSFHWRRKQVYTDNNTLQYHSC